VVLSSPGSGFGSRKAATPSVPLASSTPKPFGQIDGVFAAVPVPTLALGAVGIAYSHSRRPDTWGVADQSRAVLACWSALLARLSVGLGPKGSSPISTPGRIQYLVST
jgi:hypothetical protein